MRIKTGAPASLLRRELIRAPDSRSERIPDVIRSRGHTDVRMKSLGSVLSSLLLVGRLSGIKRSGLRKDDPNPRRSRVAGRNARLSQRKGRGVRRNTGVCEPQQPGAVPIDVVNITVRKDFLTRSPAMLFGRRFSRSTTTSVHGVCASGCEHCWVET